MGSKWETVRLGDLTKWSSGGTPNKSEDSYWNGTIPWISASSMEGHLYSDSKLKITEDGLINGSRLAPANSILLLVRGSILHQKIQVGLATKAVAFNQDVKCLIVNNDMIDPWYLLLWFKAKEQDLLKIVESTGIGAGKLDTKLLMDYPVEIPPKEIKEYIRFLGKAIFDKITLNENINYNLEKMSQTLFKSWFVDFDPVIDNALDVGNQIPEALQARAELRQKVRNSADFKPLPTEIRSLFPSEFEETELGWVPKGWEIGKLQDLLILQRGFDLPSTQRNIGLHPIIAASGYNGTHDIAMVKAPGIVTGRSGVLGNVFLILEDFWPLNTTLWVKELKHATPCYGYELLKMIDFSSFNGGSAVPTLNRNHIHNLDYLLPPRNLIEKFELFSMSLYRQVHEFKKQAQTLTALRDTLLPKLISGELSLEDLPDLSTDTEAA
ncbi:restriction endonuclease subunit S [Escherichia coli]|uniref:Restriction endonuclease subunit S n=1 Tax=Escherichia coli TaxID=562 RepID=A0A0L7AL00_ECOLX|nr:MULTISPECIES: restriction endonuclease subunit S [Escherichia]EHQ5578302.1 restriction endonuclease subunit S [Escherichia coli O2]EGB60913.1 type I restriction modification DNA specificity domain-containing protein [Escherichia coli M863]EGE61984.1 type I restriction modification DNA specificity domain protein [Escherichia coli STEC_7v]EGO6588757.1 restriction endonuclease subunit S [Escherichia coli]EGO7493385.1 restriction endonuclease subunit S [Escherichia coli]